MLEKRLLKIADQIDPEQAKEYLENKKDWLSKWMESEYKITRDDWCKILQSGVLELRANECDRLQYVELGPINRQSESWTDWLCGRRSKAFIAHKHRKLHHLR